MNVIGLDLSSSATGVCAPHGSTFTIEPKGTLHQRCRTMRDEITHLLETHSAVGQKPDLIVMEAIGTRHVQTAIAIATVHALVREAIGDHWPLWLVEPTRLKKWATGKGAGKGTDKVGIALAAQRNGWDAPLDAGDDEADAWWLWTIGRAHLGEPVVDETAYRTDLLTQLREEAPCANGS